MNAKTRTHTETRVLRETQHIDANKERHKKNHKAVDKSQDHTCISFRPSSGLKLRVFPLGSMNTIFDRHGATAPPRLGVQDNLPRTSGEFRIVFFKDNVPFTLERHPPDKCCHCPQFFFGTGGQPLVLEDMNVACALR